MQTRAADEIWVATALLRRQHPDRSDFSVDEIVMRAEVDNVANKKLHDELWEHAIRHCVVNNAYDSGRYRMLFQTSKGRRRLFRPEDPFGLGQNLGRFTPRKDEMPQKYWELIDWYWNEYVGGGRQAADPILNLRGLGKAIWADEDADAYVERLREDRSEPDILGHRSIHLPH